MKRRSSITAKFARGRIVEVKGKAEEVCRFVKMLSEGRSEISLSLPQELVLSQEKPDTSESSNYSKFFESKASATAYGVSCKYIYYKDEKNASYYALITGGKNDRKIPLGSLNDPNSRIRKVYETFSKITKPVSKIELQKVLPNAEGRSQRLKAILDILVAEKLVKRLNEKGEQKYVRA